MFATYYIRKAWRVTRKVGVGGRSRAGQCPAPTGQWVFDCVVFPVGCDARQIATGGIYAAPTNQPVIFIKIQSRGRGGGFCMLRHSPVVIGDTICRESRADGVVIYSTVRGGGVVIGSTVWGLLFTAQFGFAARGLLFPTQFKTVVIHGTFPLFAQKIGLLSAAQLRLGLLFSAQFGRVVKHSTVAAACRLTAF